MASTADSSGSALRFECTECGKCCRIRGEYAHVYVNEEEVLGLAARLGMRPYAFRRKYTYKDALGWRQLFFRGDHCVFLDDETGKCTVYEARPTQCRTYPFWRSLVRDGRWTEEAKLYCEGLDRGPEHDSDEVEALMLDQERADEG